jgi:isopentenyl-diphosphate Delta-isomerase
MANTEELLEVIDEHDVVIGLETRATVHSLGLLHREIHIWFMTPQAEIIFQHRAKDKDTYPDKLDATVGGHVDPGMTYDQTAVKECFEETGVRLQESDLVLLTKMRKRAIDEATGAINNTLRAQYAYLYERPLTELVPEPGKSQGFEAWKIDTLTELSENDRARFIPLILSDEFLSLFRQARSALSI